jgi:UDP-glucose 4-epimerase
MDIYGVTKMAGEKIMAILAKRCSIQVMVGRFFNAVGPRETNPHIIPEILNQLRERPDGPLLLGNLFPKRDYIHVSDIADAAIAATLGTRDSYDIVNIGAGNDVTVGGLVDIFADALGRIIPIECDASRVRKTDRMRLRADNTKLRTKYGWRPQRSLEAAIEDLLATAGVPKAAAVTSASV